ncbi:hypothetical protein ES703_86247 [subsurface metagenome]
MHPEDLFYLLPNSRNNRSNKVSRPSDTPRPRHHQSQTRKSPSSRPPCRCPYRMPATKACDFLGSPGYPGVRKATLLFPRLPLERIGRTCLCQTCKLPGWVPALRGPSCTPREVTVCSSSVTRRKALPIAICPSRHPGSAGGIGQVRPEELIGVPCNKEARYNRYVHLENTAAITSVPFPARQQRSVPRRCGCTYVPRRK